MRRTALYTAAALLLATSCNKELMESQKMGSISLSLSSDVEVVTQTKADAVDCSDFLVDIYGTTFLGNEYESETYVYENMPESIAVPFGSYHVSAQNCIEEEAEAGFGQVRYYGVSEQVDVFSYAKETVIIQCRMANGKASIIFDRSFQDDFADVSAELSVGARTVPLTAEESATSDVYFNVPAGGADLVYKVYGTVGKGTEQERRLSYTNAASPMKLSPAKWTKITIKSNHNGIIGPDITVDGNMGNDTTTEVIDPEQGSDIADGTVAVSILVDTQMDDATVVDCEIDIFK